MVAQREMPLTLSIENIGGLVGRRDYEIRPGLNLISAPNASGKSSLIHALQTLVLEDRDLRSRDHFLHSFSLAEGARVELTMANGAHHVRRLRSAGEGILSVGGEPLHPEGAKVSLFCIASEDNELVERVKAGRPLANPLLDLSEYRHYELLASFFEQERASRVAQLSQHRDQRAQLETLRAQLRTRQQDLEELEAERRALREIPAERVAENEQDARRLADAQRQLHQSIQDLTSAEGERERLKNTLETHVHQEQRFSEMVRQFENEHPDDEQELATMDREIAGIRSEISDLQRKMQSQQDRLQDTNQNWNRHLKHGEDECFSCGNAISGELLRERQRSLESSIRVIARDISELQWRLQQRQKERNDFSQYAIQVKSQFRARLNDARREIARMSDQLKKVEERITELLPKRKALSELVVQLEAHFDREVRELLEQRRRVDERIARTDQDVKTLQARIQDIGDVQQEIAQLENEIGFHEQAARYMTTKAEEVKDAVKSVFNEHIREVYELLEFSEDFEQIYLDDQYNLKIVRRFQGQRKLDTINTLSRSEKETVALVLMLAGREAYLSNDEFPFFIADETSFFDPTRFKRIVSYVSERVPYTVVTRLAPREEQEEITVEYAVPA